MAKKTKKILETIGLKGKKDDIENVVLKCFIRVLKDNGSYLLYRRCVTNNGVMKSILMSKGITKISSDNPFSTASSSEDVIKTLRKITNDMARSNGKSGGINDLDKYEVVTMAINHLLHFFMESNGISMQRLCEMGEEIYGLSCNKLFGDTIEDLEKQSEDELSSMTDISKIQAKLFQDFIVDLQQGKISSSTGFDKYVNEKIKDKKKASEILQSVPRMGKQDGIMLGEMPHGGRMERPTWLDDYDDVWEEDNRF